ncbi:MAG: DUF1573 domain-containing protein [Porphyromonadaceae bacterium]|nr:DUF1573 domain-containing protein [Porphyromonadaceae bacterium]
MTRKLVFLATLFVFSVVAHVSAQKATITFANKTHNFGQFAEDGGSVSHVFEFTNTGSAPLIIQRVNASCGCTTPQWTQTPVEPGKKGTVTATYNPLGRPGAFSKEVYVYTNASNEMERLTISGNVTPRANSSTSTQSSASNYPIQIGNLGLNNKIAQFGNVSKGSVQSRAIAVKNNGTSTLKVSFTNIPSYLTVSASPESLQPNQEGVINIGIDSKKATEWGPVNDAVFVVLNGNKQLNDNFKINIIGNITEDFSKLSSSDRRQAPIMEIKSNNLNFGRIKKGSKVRGKIAIKNVGTNPLEIRRIVNNNSDISIHPNRTTIRGGKTENIHLDIDSKYLPKGDYKKTFTVQTNDPNKSLVVYIVDFSVI